MQRGIEVNISTNGGKRQVTLSSKERAALGSVQDVLKNINELLKDDDAGIALAAIKVVEARYPANVKQ
jgi:hypothetical protein